jgi:tRNA-intron lyase
MLKVRGSVSCIACYCYGEGMRRFLTNLWRYPISAAAFWLRDRYGIVGAMIGGIAEFKQQNRVRGLPLQLCPEEVSFLLRELGVIRLYSMHEFSNKIRSRKREALIDSDSSDTDSSDSESSSSDSSREEVSWQHALANGTEFVIPDEMKENDEQRQWDCEWNYPSTIEEKHRYLVFADLKKKKYSITAGSKFGCDYLLYPGDPTLFHAQFCVNIVHIDTPFVVSSLSASCRGSFQARKHLLHAAVDENNQILYTTFGQIGGFG